jgi:hypothetical protein
MYEPISSTGKTYLTKIVIHSNYEWKLFMNHHKFRDYITNESINIDRNYLDTVIPHNFGFLKEVTANWDTTLLHRGRIMKLIPNAPEFQITLQKIYGNNKKFAFVAMVQTSRENVNKMTELITDGKFKNSIPFLPWKAYNACETGKKLPFTKKIKNGMEYFKV